MRTNPLQQLINGIAEAGQDPAMRGAEDTCLTLPTSDWKKIATAARIAQAALRRIKKVGSKGQGEGTEEHEIAKAALRRLDQLGEG